MEDFTFPNLRYSIKQKCPSTISDDGWGMDNTHVMILFNLLLAYPYKKVLEVGSHRGFPTMAFIEAINMGCTFEVHFCDTNFEKSVYDICEGYKQIYLHNMRSVDYLAIAEYIDFALLDSSHISEDVEDEFEYLLMIDIQSVLLHDTCTQTLPQNIDKPWFDGPLFLKHKLMAFPNWLCIADAFHRKGEQMERGLFFATQNVYIYNQANKIFKIFKPELLS